MTARKSIKLLLALGVALPASALAQDATTPGAALQNAPVTLDTVVLSGGLSPIEASAYGRSATTLDGQDLRDQGVPTVADALRYVPSVAVGSSGVGLTEIRIRGAEANQTMILIDGIEAGAGDRPYVLGGLDAATVERIEVLRGPQSVFFGASAASGVINVITDRRAKGGQAGFEVGNGAAGWVSTGTGNDRGHLSISGAVREDDGYDVSAGDGGDDDGLRRKSGTLSGEVQATADLRMGFYVRAANERYDFDATNFSATGEDDYLLDSDDQIDRDELSAELFAEATTFDGRVVSRLSWQQTRLDQSKNGGPEAKARTRALRWRALIGLNGGAADATQTLGLALDRRTDDNNAGDDNERKNTSVAAEYRAALGNGVDLQFGLRHDDNSRFDSKTSYVAAGSWRIEGTPYRLHASVGTGIVNPEYIELLGGFDTVGNPDLEPEENRAFDLGIETTFAGDRGLFDLTLFRERLKNEITYTFLTLPDGSNYFNQDGTSDRKGFEVTGRYDVTDNLTLGANYSYLDASNPDGTVELRRPQHKLAMTATARLLDDRASVSGSIVHVRDSYDRLGWGGYYVAELPDYTVVNVAGSYDLTERARLTARVENLFDEDYSDAWGYASRGREGWVGVETRW